MSIAISAVCTGERAGAVSYFQTNLVSDGFAAVTDPALKNSWGTTETSEFKATYVLAFFRNREIFQEKQEER